MNDSQELKNPNDISVASGIEVRDVHEAGDSWVLDDRMRRMLMDLQRHWLTDYQQSREKLLVEMTERVSFLCESNFKMVQKRWRLCNPIPLFV
jgi:hypothetical protein